MTSLIGSVLRALFAFTVALYILYPRETGQWVRDLLTTSSSAFCPKEAAPAPPSHFLLNRGHCNAPVKASQAAQPTLQSLLGKVVTGFNAER